MIRFGCKSLIGQIIRSIGRLIINMIIRVLKNFQFKLTGQKRFATQELTEGQQKVNEEIFVYQKAPFEPNTFVSSPITVHVERPRLKRRRRNLSCATLTFSFPFSFLFFLFFCSSFAHSRET